MYMSTVYLDFQLAHVFLFMVTVAMIHALSDSLFSLERFDGSRADQGTNASILKNESVVAICWSPSAAVE